MNEILENLVPIFGIVFGCSIILIPIMGLTIRFAIKPAVEVWAKLKQGQTASTEMLVQMERRMSYLEHQLETMQTSVKQLTEGQEFDRKLGSPKS